MRGRGVERGEQLVSVVIIPAFQPRPICHEELGEGD